MFSVSRIFLGFALVLPAAMAVSAETPPVCGGKPLQARIIEVTEGATLRLEDGRSVRLASVLLPLPIDGDEAAVKRATEILREIAIGKTASVFLLSDAKDRYGRLDAQAISIEGKIWLEQEILSRGFARALPSANDKCTKVLLQFEAKAREANIGLWNEEKFQQFDAGNLDALNAAEGRFAVVEGVISRVGEARGRVYLDFGRRFKEDFTVIVPERTRKVWASQGSDPKGWRGKRVRVRGILFSWGGPAIEVNVAPAIEFLDPALSKSE